MFSSLDRGNLNKMYNALQNVRDERVKRIFSSISVRIKI